MITRKMKRDKKLRKLIMKFLNNLTEKELNNLYVNLTP